MTRPVGQLPSPWLGPLMLAVMLSMPIAARGDEDETPSIGLAGSGTHVWIYSYTTDGRSGRRLLSFGVWPESREAFFVPLRLKGLVGRVHSLAIVGQDLHVIFDEGTHRRYCISTQRETFPRVRDHTERALPQHAKPLALAGHEATNSVYAIVGREIAEGILLEQARRERERANENANAKENDNAGEQAAIEPINIDATLAAAQYMVARYESGRWGIVSGLPAWFDAQQECHMAIDVARRAHVLFTGGPRQPYQHAWYADDRWSAPVQVIDDPGFRMNSVSAFQDRLVAVGVVESDGAVAISAVSFDGSKWVRQKPFLLDEAGSRFNATELATARFGHSIAVAVLNDEQQLMFGRWPIAGGAPRQPLRVVEGLKPGEGATLSRRSQSITAFAALGILLLYVFLRRGGGISREANLPAQYVVASYWRRLCGFMIDAAPIALASMKSWVGPLSVWLDEYHEWERQGGPVPPLGDDVLQGWAIACAAYTIFCTICELLFSTTPGKLAVRCRVVDENGQRCRLGQIVVRNALRMVELFPLFRLWPTFILMLFTRNRQRLGDLMARTLVVVQVPPSRAQSQRPHRDENRHRDQPTPSG